MAFWTRKNGHWGGRAYWIGNSDVYVALFRKPYTYKYSLVVRDDQMGTDKWEFEVDSLHKAKNKAKNLFRDWLLTKKRESALKEK